MGLKELKEIDAKIVTQLQEMNKYREDNKIEFFDTSPKPGPNPRQQEILEAWLEEFYKTFTFTGGERSGKTTILTLIGISVMAGEYPWDNIHSRKGSPTRLNYLFPHSEPRKIRYIGQDWKEHIQDVVIPELMKWWPANRVVKRRGNGIIPDTEWIDVKTGSSLNILSNNQDPRVHRGWYGDLILYDEPPSHEIYIANARGLVDRKGREFIAATLLEEPWIHQNIIQKKLKNGRPDPTVFNVHTRSSDNVGYGITQEGLDEYGNKLSDEEKEQHLEGVPSYMSGLIFPKYDRKLHLRDRFQIPLDWIVDIAIDSHPRVEQAILFVATAPDNRRYIINEIWEHGDGTWIGEQIVRMISRNAYRVGTIVCDPLAKGDSNEENTTFDKIEQVLMRHGHILETASKDQASGILEIKNHLVGPNKEASIFCFNDLIRTIYEFEGWMWDKDTQKPQKNFHFMENLYRLLLLNTQYTEPEEEGYEESSYAMGGRDAQTGY